MNHESTQVIAIKYVYENSLRWNDVTEHSEGEQQKWFIYVVNALTMKLHVYYLYLGNEGTCN